MISTSLTHLLINETSMVITLTNTLFGLTLFTMIGALTVSDLRSMLLPNYLNALLALTGMCQSLVLAQPHVLDAVLGAAIGAAFLVLLRLTYRHLRGINGIGSGDIKFTAAAGLWIGWQGLPLMLTVASSSALAFVGIQSALARRFDRYTMLPFGPFLGLGLLVAWAAMVAL